MWVNSLCVSVWCCFGGLFMPSVTFHHSGPLLVLVSLCPFPTEAWVYRGVLEPAGLTTEGNNLGYCIQYPKLIGDQIIQNNKRLLNFFYMPGNSILISNYFNPSKRDDLCSPHFAEEETEAQHLSRLPNASLSEEAEEVVESGSPSLAQIPCTPPAPCWLPAGWEDGYWERAPGRGRQSRSFKALSRGHHTGWTSHCICHTHEEKNS